MDEVSIEKARARLGDYVNDAQNGTLVLITRSGKPAAMLVPLTRLTDGDRDLIAGARETGPVLRARTADVDRQAGWQLKELAALAERLGGPAPDEEENHG